VAVIGTSFARWRAEGRGLDYRAAFERVVAMRFGILRLSASWREIEQFGYEYLDWLLTTAERARQTVLLTVGMKALGWPEFYLPEGLSPNDAPVRQRALMHVREVARRYRDNPALVAWQIENEPFNRSGPNAWWIPRSVVRAEAEAVRSLDPDRPLVVTTFAHFDADLDRTSSRQQSRWKRRLGLAVPAEREALSILRPGDILGLDVYSSIGWLDPEGRDRLARAAPDQIASVTGWQRVARQQGKRIWVTEAQAEPWEARSTQGDPISIRPESIGELVDRLTGIGIETIVLWGSEYWLGRADRGDPRWIEAVALVLKALA
jgi:cellulase (glycosyl hydrolase family 5)